MSHDLPYAATPSTTAADSLRWCHREEAKSG